MRKNIQKVLEAFARGEALGGQTCSTSGQALFSYNLCIGYRKPNGDVVLLEYGKAPSATTRSHIKAAEGHFGKVARVAACAP